MSSKFVQLSINMQDSAVSKQDALRLFNNSCNICANRGLKIECGKCPLKAHHELVIAVFDDLEQYDTQIRDK